MKLVAAALLALFSAMPATAEDLAANEASIRELLAVMRSEQLVDGMFSEIDRMMEASMREALAGRAVTSEQREILDDMRVKLGGIFREEMSWSSFEPMMIEIYRNSFSESEIQSMLQFYKSEAGQAVVAKMPTVIHQSMQVAQKRMGALGPKLRQLQQETIERLRATCKNSCGN